MHDNTGASLVGASSNGEPITTSLIIAEGVGLQHKNVLETIRKNLPDFEEFGVVAFQTRVAGQDFIQKNLDGQDKLGRRREIINHIITLDMAKELAMIQRTERGKQARQYFIEVEKRYRVKPHIDTSSITRLEIAQMLVNAETERLALEAKNREADRIGCDEQGRVDQAGRGCTQGVFGWCGAAKEGTAACVSAGAGRSGHGERNRGISRPLRVNCDPYIKRPTIGIDQNGHFVVVCDRNLKSPSGAATPWSMTELAEGVQYV